MRSVDQQLEMVGHIGIVPRPVRIAITDALGLMCAEEIVATEPMPRFPYAAIDGYAVRAVDVGGERGLYSAYPARTSSEQRAYTAENAEDVQGESPLPDIDPDAARSQKNIGQTVRALPVVGEIEAGSQQPLRLQPKQAMRVHAGAPLPTLADAVLPLAWTDLGRKRMMPQRSVRSGEFVRASGADIQPGDIAVPHGAIITPAHVGLLAAVGRSKVLAYPRPRVSIISVGAELVDVDKDPGLGQVYDMNSYALAAAAKEAGAEVHRVGIATGEPRRLREIVENELLRSEFLIISGAVGGAGGAHMRAVLQELGEIDVSRVAMHPGSVQGYGFIGENDTPVYLVPSNTVSALVIFEVFIRPIIRRGLGKRAERRRFVQARALSHTTSIVGRRGFIRSRLMRDADTRGYLVESLSGASGAPAHLLAGLSEANALLHIPEDVASIRPGDVVDVLFLSQNY